jgi:hypothetical protein
VGRAALSRCGPGFQVSYFQEGNWDHRGEEVGSWVKEGPENSIPGTMGIRRQNPCALGLEQKGGGPRKRREEEWTRDGLGGPWEGRSSLGRAAPPVAVSFRTGHMRGRPQSWEGVLGSGLLASPCPQAVRPGGKCQEGE